MPLEAGGIAFRPGAKRRPPVAERGAPRRLDSAAISVQDRVMSDPMTTPPRSRPAEVISDHALELLQAMPLGVQCVALRDGRLIVAFVNRRFCELLGIDRAEIEGLEDA